MVNIKRVLRLAVVPPLRPLRFYSDTVRLSANSSFPPFSIVLVGLPLPFAVILPEMLDILTAPIHGVWHVVAIALLTIAVLYLLAWLIYFLCRNV